MPWLLAAGFVLSGVGAVVFVDVDLKGSWEGLYVVRRGSEFAVTNELLLGNESRVIVGVDGPSPVGNPSVTPEGDRPRLVSELDPQEGSGWGAEPGGREWVVTFSRYVDPQGKRRGASSWEGAPPASWATRTRRSTAPGWPTSTVCGGSMSGAEPSLGRPWGSW